MTTSSRVSPADAAEELLRRREARRGLLPFTQYTFRQYRAERAHAIIASALDAVVRGELRRLMVFAPPQHGKSQLVSVQLPAYWLGRRPEDPVLLASYGASLAESKSRQARAVVESDAFGRLFPGVRTRRDSRAVDRWQLDGRRGGLLAAGVAGPLTGSGGLLGIIDDPHASWAEAQSETVREGVWEWYRGTFRTRIWEGGAIVLIQTRWHEEDLAGKLLAEQSGEWTILRLPAVAETQAERDQAAEHLGLPDGEPDPLGRKPGEPLCPGRFSAEALAELKADVGSQAWYAEYQARPQAPEGNRFKRAWFKVVEAAPAEVVGRVRYWDLAATEGGGDYTAGVLMSRTTQGVFTVEDVVHGQWSPGARNEVIRQTAEADRQRSRKVITWVEQEPGSSGVESAASLVRLLAGFAVRSERVTGDKEIRAEPFAAQAEAGNVRMVRGPWNAKYLDELASFPAGAHDDQVDGSSGAFNKLAGGHRRLNVFA